MIIVSGMYYKIDILQFMMCIFHAKYVCTIDYWRFLSKELQGILCGAPNSSGLVLKTSQMEDRVKTDKIITPCVLLLTH